MLRFLSQKTPSYAGTTKHWDTLEGREAFWHVQTAAAVVSYTPPHFAW